MKNYKLIETHFDIKKLGKYETIMSLGNGYLGYRTVTEENYENKHYGLFIGGTFNKPTGDEVPELPNMPDLTSIEIIVNGDKLNLQTGKIVTYKRELNIYNGELIRDIEWISPSKDHLLFQFKTFLSYDKIHNFHQKITIQNMGAETINLNFNIGINAQITNSGTQHFQDYETRFFDQQVQQYGLITDDNNLKVYVNRVNKFKLDNENINIENAVLSVYGYDRRKVYQSYDTNLQPNSILVLKSASSIYTSNDFDFDINNNEEKLFEMYAEQLIEFINNGYDNNFIKHSNIIKKRIWDNAIKFETTDDNLNLYVNLAQYHMYKFTPQFDNWLNIDAKGWVGEEYKGHSFWDTEIYILPNYIFLTPNKAKDLLLHRYHMLSSALLKAQENNFIGAMWPWETSRSFDGETCPTWGEVDFKTGKRMKVWAGFNELHVGVGVDIMWAIYQYYRATNDFDFMVQYGYEMLILTSIFWSQKAEKNQNGLYEIKNVTSPNKYKENINNNTFTNFMVKEMLAMTLQLIAKLKLNNTNMFNELNNKTRFLEFESQIRDVANHMLILKQDINGIYPENDTFNQLKTLPNIEEFKNKTRSLWAEYTSEDLNQYQLLKQADIVTLMYAMFDKFDAQTIINNWKHYENITLHTSSLSLSMHAVTAAMIKENELAWDFFNKASEVDFGYNTNKSDNGIHAAATGGIIKSIIEGFVGLRFDQEHLAINPAIPKQIKRINFDFFYKTNIYNIDIDEVKIQIKSKKINDVTTIIINGTKYLFDSQTEIEVPRW